MEPVQDERLLDAVAVGDVEQPRPEVVVLALAERRVVAQPVVLEELALEDDRVVEDRRAEERAPAHRSAPGLVHVDASGRPSSSMSSTPAPDEADP